jgi:succinoglycan biosynthesis transport protein ExoP
MDIEQLTLEDYLEIIRRRVPWLAIPFTLVLLASVLYAINMPSIYRSTGTVLVESQQVPEEFIRSTVTSLANERLRSIEQRVMTRERLLSIYDRFGLLFDSASDLSDSDKLKQIRDNVNIEYVAGDHVGGGRGGTVAFRVSYDDRDPVLAQKVADQLITYFLSENVRSRTERAAETTEFLAQESRRLKGQLDAIEQQIVEIKQENKDALPEHRLMLTGMLERTQSDLQDTDREIASTRQEKRILQVERNAAMSGTNLLTSTNDGVSTPAAQLAAYELELAELRARFKDSHPDVIDLLRRIQETRRTVEERSEQNGELTSDPTVARIDLQIAASDQRIASLQNERQQLQTRVRELEANVIAIPQVEQALNSLEREKNNALLAYEEVRAKEMEAQLAENLEEGQKAERFTLLEPPVVPDVPYEPNRKKLVAFGFILAVAAGGGALLLVESLDGSIRGGAAVARVFNQPPLVAIPLLVTERDVSRRKQLIRLVIVAAVVILVAMLIGMHILYKPLDLIWNEIIHRFA